MPHSNPTKKLKLGRPVSGCCLAPVATATGKRKDMFCTKCDTFLVNGTTGKEDIARVIEAL